MDKTKKVVRIVSEILRFGTIDLVHSIILYFIVSQHQNKMPNTIKTNIKAATSIHPYSRPWSQGVSLLHIGGFMFTKFINRN